MNLETSLLPPGTPRDQPYICPHCQEVFISFRSPTNSNYVQPPIVQRLTVDNARLTCGKFNCWDHEVNAHGHEREMFFAGIKRRKQYESAPPKESWD